MTNRLSIFLIKQDWPHLRDWTRFDLFYSAVERYWAFQVHFYVAKLSIYIRINKRHDFLGEFLTLIC